jgi:heptosyltransferase-3
MSGFPFQHYPPRRILLVCTQRIGDVLLVTPLARSLKAAWPNTELTVLVLRGTEGVLEGNPDVDELIPTVQRQPWRQRWQLIKQLWRRYDLAISPLPTDRARILCWIAGKWRVGFITTEAKEKSKTWLLNQWHYFDDFSTHTVAMGLRLTELLNIPAHYQVVPPQLTADAASSLLARHGLASSAYVVLHPYPKFAYKLWTVPGWQDLAGWLQHQGWKVVLTGGPDPDECLYAQTIADHVPGIINLAGQLSLAATATLIRGAALFVGPDTAASHIAAACGTPTVALFGPSNPIKWGPWPAGFIGPTSPWPWQGGGLQGNVYLLQGQGECVPCRFEGCDRHVQSLSRCLQSITFVQVQAAVAAVLHRPDLDNVKLCHENP